MLSVSSLNTEYRTGRGESLLHPDQDNGFILADHAVAEHESIDRFFIELAQRFTRGLEQIHDALPDDGI